MNSSTTTQFWLHDCHVDPVLGRITRGQQSVQLSAHQVRVLLLLTQKPGKTLSQREIEEAVWGDSTTSSEALYRCIAQLRSAFCDHAKRPRFIQTVPRRGYRLIAPIHHSVCDAPQAPPVTVEPEVRAPNPTRLQRATPAALCVAIANHYVPIICGISVVVVLAGLGLWWHSTERIRAQHETTTATQLTRFMEDVFTSGNLTMAAARPDTAPELLNRARQRLSADLKNQPQVRAQMLETIGRSYLHQRLAEPAVSALEEALRIRRNLGNPPSAVAGTLGELGDALRGAGRLQDAKLAYRDALDIFQLTQPQPSKDATLALRQLGNLEVDQGRFTAGIHMLEMSLQQMRTVQGFYHTDTAGILLDLSRACVCNNELQHADQALREAQRIYQTAATLHPDRVAAEHAAGQILLQQHRFEEAAVVLERALESRRQLFGNQGLPISETLNLLASARNGQGRLHEAEALKLAALAALEGLGASADLQRATAKLSLATLLMRSNQFTRSEALLREAIAFYDANLPTDHLSRTSAEYYLGETLLAQKRYPEAQLILQGAIERMRHADIPQWRIARSMNTLGEVLYRQGNTDAARKLLLESYTHLASDTSAKDTARTKAQQRMTTLLGNTAALAGITPRR